MRAFWGPIVAFFLVVIVGAVAFQVGVSVSGQVAGQAAPGAVPYYGHPWGWGFGIGFGFLFPLLFIALIAAAFSAARGGRYGHGGWIDHRRTMLEEWHRQAHSGETSRASDPGTRRDS
jgi:hypothetical protein